MVVFLLDGLREQILAMQAPNPSVLMQNQLAAGLTGLSGAYTAQEVQQVLQQQAIQQLQQHAFNEVDNDNDSRQADNRKKRKASKQSLEDRLKAEDVGSLVKSESGHTFTFNLEKSK